jgi:hypothetical protein
VPPPDWSTGGRLLDADAAARAARVPPGTFGRWVAEHRVPVVAHDDEGRQLFLEADVLDAERATRRRPRLARLVTEASQADTPQTQVVDSSIPKTQYPR